MSVRAAAAWRPLAGAALAMALALALALAGARPPAARARLLIAPGAPAVAVAELARSASDLLGRLGAIDGPTIEWATAPVDPGPVLSDPGASGLARLVRAHAQPRIPGGLLLVVLPRITELDSVAADTLGEPVGLGLHPDRVERAGLPELTRLGPFTPTAVVSLEALGRLRAEDRPAAVAHELLHALGLTHSSMGDLMATDPRRRSVTLSDDQRRALRPADPAWAPEPWQDPVLDWTGGDSFTRHMRRGGSISTGGARDPSVYFRDQTNEETANAAWGFRCAWFDPDLLNTIRVGP